MGADEAYQWLIGSSARSAHDSFDIHVVASVLALAMTEVKGGPGGMSQGTGLDKPALMELIGAMFPDSMSDFAGLLDDTAIVIDAEEQSVRDILGMFATGAGRLERYLAAVIARRCKSPHHL